MKIVSETLHKKLMGSHHALTELERTLMDYSEFDEVLLWIDSQVKGEFWPGRQLSHLFEDALDKHSENKTDEIIKYQAEIRKLKYENQTLREAYKVLTGKSILDVRLEELKEAAEKWEKGGKGESIINKEV